MSEQFDYYYGLETEQFTFYRIPKLLIKDIRFKKLSSDAKLLYGLMLDRMSLSIKNSWFDEYNRAYIIYTLDNIMEDLDCSKSTVVKIMKELDTKSGIGLIEKKRRGMGKPDIIYVKNFTTRLQYDDNYNVHNVTKTNIENNRDINFKTQELQISEVKNNKFYNSRSLKFTTQEVQNLYPNNTNINYTDFNNINLINQSNVDKIVDKRLNVDNSMDKANNININYNNLIEMVKHNLSYDYYINDDSYIDKDLYVELFNIICDIVCVKREFVKINGEEYPYNLVRSQFLKLKPTHLQYVIECFKNTTTQIYNIKSYLLTALYNSIHTTHSYYQQSVIRDMVNDKFT